MAWRRLAASLYLNQCWPDSSTHICGTRGRWVNGLDITKSMSTTRTQSKCFFWCYMKYKLMDSMNTKVFCQLIDYWLMLDSLICFIWSLRWYFCAVHHYEIPAHYEVSKGCRIHAMRYYHVLLIFRVEWPVGLTLIPACISNHMLCKVWDEITYPFLKFNGATVEV